MSVTFNEEKKIFRLDTEKSTYVMGVSPEGFLGHIYYGDRLFMEADNYLLRMEEPPYTPSVNKREKSAFLDFFPHGVSNRRNRRLPGKLPEYPKCSRKYGM